MGIKAQSSAHTKWLCKYYIVFSPKYRRKVIYIIKKLQSFNNTFLLPRILIPPTL